MGKHRNRRRHKNKNKVETKPKFETERGPFGFAAGIDPDDDSVQPSYSQYSSFSCSRKQPVQNPDNVISTSQGFMEVLHSAAWGDVLIPVEDPKALTLSSEELNGIKLIENFPKVPARLWSRWMKLCAYQCQSSKKTEEAKPEAMREWNSAKQSFEYYHYRDGKKINITDPSEVVGAEAKYRIGGECYGGSYHPYHHTNYQQQLEVSALFCRKMDDLTQWKILIPRQQVSHASVRAETAQSVDIETGEVYGVFPPTGWLHAGSTHSHNTMGAFFSKTDDDSELSVPGLHIVVGSIKVQEETYDALASIVLRQVRKRVNLKDVVETKHMKEVDFHQYVLECISTYSSSISASTDKNDASPGAERHGSLNQGNTFSKDDEDDEYAFLRAMDYESKSECSSDKENDDDYRKFFCNIDIEDEESSQTALMALHKQESTKSTARIKSEIPEISTQEDEESWWDFYKKKLLSSIKSKKPEKPSSDFVSTSEQ